MDCKTRKYYRKSSMEVSNSRIIVVIKIGIISWSNRTIKSSVATRIIKWMDELAIDIIVSPSLVKII